MNNLRQRLFTLKEVMRLGVNVADVPIGTTIKGLWMPINILNGGSSVLFLLSIDLSSYSQSLLSSLKLVYNNKNGSTYCPTAMILASNPSEATLYVTYNAISFSSTFGSTNNKYVLFGIWSPISLGTGTSGDGYGSLVHAGAISSLYLLNAMFYGDDNTYYVYINFEPLCTLLQSTIKPATVTLKTKPSESKQIYCVTA